jgi:tetratricopeptide (TPR) repeat protein
MPEQIPAASREVSSAVAEYRMHDNLGSLLDRLREISERFGAGELAAAAEPYHDLPEVVIPIYERIVEITPHDARALVRLANAYWLTGRGVDAVSALASRAIDCDPSNRGAWHLWALAEPEIRARVERWQKVAERFPADQLARAALADNATSLASEEHDPLALDLAIRTYESLLAEASQPNEIEALTTALETLRGWRL